VPAICSLDDPAAGSPPDAADERPFASSANVGHHTALARLVLGVVVVVALVEAEIPRPPRTAWRLNGDCVERRADHPLVVNVRSGQGDREGNAATVGQDMALAAQLRAIGRVGASEFPPFGAFTMALSSEAQSQSIPLS
jgi:hypothetical protein